MNQFMQQAVDEARKGLKHNHGGPFGAVIIRKGIIIARAHNRVLCDKDPTAHAEILAIRRASHYLQRFELSDCEIYSSCEPCPMCYSAIHWARIPELYYGCTKKDAAKIGFDDEMLYGVLMGVIDDKNIKIKQIERDICLGPFREWEVRDDKISY